MNKKQFKMGAPIKCNTVIEQMIFNRAIVEFEDEHYYIENNQLWKIKDNGKHMKASKRITQCFIDAIASGVLECDNRVNTNWVIASSHMKGVCASGHPSYVVLIDGKIMKPIAELNWSLISDIWYILKL
jgi:hypothetical protein